MSYSYPKKFIPSSTSSTTQVKTSRLKDNSWIRKDEEEDEDIDRDPNFGKSILGHVSTVTSDSKVPENTTDTKSTSYVQSLTKRFGGSQDELDKISTSPNSRITTNKRSSTLPSPRSSLSSTSSITESPKTSGTTSTTVSEKGKKTETTTITSTRFTDRVFSDGKSLLKGAPYAPLSPSSTKVTETTITSIKGAEDPYLDTLTFKSKPGAVKTGTEGNTYSTTKTRTSSSAEDKLFDSLIPSIKSDPNSSVSTTVTTTSVVKVESLNEEVFPATPTTKSYSSSEDQLYDTLLPKSITGLSPSSSTTSIRREVKTVESSPSEKYSSYSPTVTSSEPDFSDKYSSTTRTYSSSGLDPSDKYSSTTRTYSSSGLDPSDKYSSTTRTYSSSGLDPSDKYSSTTRTYSSSGPDLSDKYNSTSRTYSSSGPDSSYEYTTINSPSVYTTTSTTYKDSRMDDYLDGGSFSSKSNIQTLYSASERTVMEKDLCSYCRKPFNTEAKMVLDDMKINCHASCFKCEVCSNNLGNLKAGDSLWIYRRAVHCDRCFEVTREKWRR